MIVLIFSFNAFCQVPTIRLGSATFIDDPNSRASMYRISKIILPPLKQKESSTESDTIAVEFHSLSPFYVKGVELCADCIVTGIDGKALNGKFKKKFVSSNEGPLDSLYTLIGGSTKCKSCYNPLEFMGMTKIISQKKYVVIYRLKTDTQCDHTYMFTKEFWITIPKVESGFTVEYDFQVE